MRRFVSQATFLTLFFCSMWAAALAQPVPSATVHIPMRDGAELTTDLYYPDGSIITNEYPCILVRLPAGRKAKEWLPLANLAQLGYVVAIQDTRSALDPEGKTLPYYSDGWHLQQDGLDTVNWLASSSFTNGKIGTAGYSAAGMTQLMLAPTAPPALKCQYVGQAGGSVYHHAIFCGGQMQKNQVETWLGYHAPHPSVFELVARQPIYNDFWDKLNAVDKSHLVEAPAVHYAGWYDTFLEGTVETFAARQTNGGKGAQHNQKLLLGPWGHFWPLDLSLGEYQVPENGRQAPIDISERRWFEYYLKGIDNGILDIPAVTYYVMGPADGSPSSGNVWRHADVWPVPSVETAVFLAESGRLSEKGPSSSTVFKYISDPNNPVPTIGGRNLFLPWGPRDQRPIETRDDVVVFTTEPMVEDLEITGKMTAKIVFASDVPDTDISLRLTDVYPDGKSLLISDGHYRTGLETQMPLSSTPKEMTIDLGTTSVVIAKGHSLRLIVAGSNYPRYEKNLHGDNEGRKANCRVHVGKSTPSRLILPLVRKGDRWLAKPPEKAMDASS